MARSEQNKLPSHVATHYGRQWEVGAVRRGLPRSLGISRELRLKKAVRFASDQGIQSLTVYALSTENWQRPKEEVSFLLDLMHKTLWKKSMNRTKKVRIVLVGDRSNLSADILQLWQNAERLDSGQYGIDFECGVQLRRTARTAPRCQSTGARAAVGDLIPPRLTNLWLMICFTKRQSRSGLDYPYRR